MKTDRELQLDVIAHLTNVYIHTRDHLLEGAEPQALDLDPEAPVVTGEDLGRMYGEVASMFIYFGVEMERLYGVSFLEHLQQQAALIVAEDTPDDPPAAT